MSQILIKHGFDANFNEVAQFAPEAAIYDEYGVRLSTKLKGLQPEAIKAQMSAATETLSALTEECRAQIVADQTHDRNALANLFDFLLPMKPEMYIVMNSGATDCNVNFINYGATYDSSSAYDPTTGYASSREYALMTPDSVVITKIVNNDTENPVELYNSGTTTGSVVSTIDGAKEEFIMKVTKSGKTPVELHDKRYLCAFGSVLAEEASVELFDTLKKIQAKGLKGMPTVNTLDDYYIWIIVPNMLSINRVVCSGFDVPMEEPTTLTIPTGQNYAGEYKAYRSSRALCEATWKLMINGEVEGVSE